MKLKNITKNRNATANEIAKQIIKDKLEAIFYYQDNEDYNKNYSEEFNNEISRHLEKHFYSITKKLNPKNDIEIYY
tara:strand:- start:233 stop:460 length:228 start_codon:yes stop_codon:yes gene_type:complete